MITLHYPTGTVDAKTKEFKPVMPVHKLKALKKTKAFKKNEVLNCFIQKMSCGRYSVFNGHFMKNTHYEVFTLSELQESFEEVA